VAGHARTFIEHGAETVEDLFVLAEIRPAIDEVRTLCRGQAGEGIPCRRRDGRWRSGAADGALPLRVESGGKGKRQQHDGDSLHERSFSKKCTGRDMRPVRAGALF
jgi:hypothetical protein